MVGRRLKRMKERKVVQPEKESNYEQKQKTQEQC